MGGASFPEGGTGRCARGESAAGPGIQVLSMVHRIAIGARGTQSTLTTVV